MPRIPYDDITPAPGDTMQRAAENVTERLHGPMIGRIVKMHGQKAADIQPVAWMHDSLGRARKMPVLPMVPLCYFAAGGFTSNAGAAVGDFCLVFPCSGAVAQWFVSGAEDAEPESARRQSLTDCVAIPGVRPFTSPLASVSSGRMRVGSNGDDKPRADFTATNADIRSPGFVIIAAGQQTQIDGDASVVVQSLFGTVQVDAEAKLTLRSLSADVAIVATTTAEMLGPDGLTIDSSGGAVVITGNTSVDVSSATVLQLDAPEILAGAGATGKVAMADAIHAELLAIATSLASVAPPPATPYVPPATADLIGSTKLKAT